MQEYDIVVVGGGPAGYVAAIRAGQLGAGVCLVESEQPGGTCLNHGCIPTKTLLHNADFVRELQKIKRRGITIADPSFTVDFPAMLKQKDVVVKKLVIGVTSLLKSHGVEVLQGRAVIEKDLTVAVYSSENNTPTKIRGKKVIFAGGSEAVRLPIPGINSLHVLTSREILALPEFPQKLVILGGGVIGVEMARIFSALGAEVTILELAGRLLPFFDPEISKELAAGFKKEKIAMHFGVRAAEIRETPEGIEVLTSDGSVFAGTHVLVCTGRKANLAAVENLELKMERGFVWVDPQMQTSIPGLYAPGDVNGRCMLAHAAFKMGEIAAENALGAKKEVVLQYVPQILYGNPEAASVGLTEEETRNRACCVGRFPMIANGRALASDQGTGFVKIIGDKQSGEILGVQMLGFNVSEIVNEAAVLMRAGVTLHQLAETIHGHPTCSEALMEAAADALGKSVHLPKKSPG